MRGNPVLAFAVGVILLAVSFGVSRTVRDDILRIVGVLALVAAVVMLLAPRLRRRRR